MERVKEATLHSSSSPGARHGDNPTTATHDDEEEETSDTNLLHKIKLYAVWKRPSAIAGLVIFLGTAATAAFLGLGISSAVMAAHKDFDRSASVLIQQVEIAFKDYEVAALWTHQACTSHEGFSHQDFRELYERLYSTGIDAQIEFLPNVTHAQRAEYEEQARAYYAKEYPYIDYKGFYGQESVNGTAEKTWVLRSDAKFYFPVHFIEPITGSEAALGMDVYTVKDSRSVDKCLRTWKPVLSEPARLVEETAAHAFSVFFFHPGTPLSTQPNLRPRDLSLVVIRIPDLVERAGQTRTCSSSVFLYDTTNASEEGTDDQLGELFLGGVQLTVSDLDRQHNGYTLHPPTSLAEVRRNSRLIRERVVPIADRQWTIAVVAVDGTYEPQFSFAVVVAVLLFVCSIFISAWIYSSIRYSNMRRRAKLTQVQSASEAEKAALVLENATRAAQAERTLNDFIAHEVRNPVAAAISACSFVRTAVHETVPLADEESRESVREDVDIIDNSLNFVNDLLRNMLDMHRASSKQLKIVMKMTDIYNDILRPVDSMLYRRGNSNVRVILDCNPPNLMVDTDQLRLKQIVLNLGRNSSKFLTTGFIRLSAHVVNGNVQLSVEDSGPGIPKEKREHLFAKFQESLDSLSQGTGIGLHLSKNLIELMNGRIWLDETYHSGIENCPGTRFVIDLNVPPSTVDDVELGQTGYDSAKSISSHGVIKDELEEIPPDLKVLFVDDDTIVRKLFCRAVKKLCPGWQIEEASNGETALQLAAIDRCRFDLIFMDQYMASVEKQLLGTETVRELRAKGVDCIICGFSANDMKKQFVEAGADTFYNETLPLQAEPTGARTETNTDSEVSRRGMTLMQPK